MRKEVPVRVGRRRGRIDRVTPKKAIEVERSGDPGKIRWSSEKLKASRKKLKILRVPEWHKKKARMMAKKVSRSITVQNLSGR